MGNVDCVTSLVDGGWVDWAAFSTEETFIQLYRTDNEDESAVNLCKSGCENICKNNLIVEMMEKTLSEWGDKYFSANLMRVLSQFFMFVFSEGIPYQFIYKHYTGTQEPTMKTDGAFHRLVPCVCHFLGEAKTVYLSIPQAPFYDRDKENYTVIETVKQGFPGVNDHVMRRGETVYLADEAGNQVDIDYIYAFYSHESDCTLVDPFQPTGRPAPVLKLQVKTTESSVSSPIAKFLGGLVEKIAGSEAEVERVKIQAGVELLCTLLASQLYYLDKPISQLSYSSFRVSPALYLLSQLPVATAQSFSHKLLSIVATHWRRSLQKPSFLYSLLFMKEIDRIQSEVHYSLPNQSLLLLVLLSSYSLVPNPFLVKNWAIDWEPYYCLISQYFSCRNLDETLLLFLFYYLLRDNKGFYSYLVSLTEPEKFLEQLAAYLYSSPRDCCNLYLTMTIVLLFTQDKPFIRYLNNDVLIPQPAWLLDYQIESISLGSVLFLSLLRLFRENIRGAREEYLHVILSACLFNIAEYSENLHELVGMDFMNLIKALFNKYQNLVTEERPTPELETSRELIRITTDILTRTIVSTYRSNPYLIYSLLLHAELIEKLKNSDIRNTNIGILFAFSQHFLPKIDSANFIVSILQHSKSFSFTTEPEMAAFRNTQCFEYFHVPEDWEPAMVPYAWAEGVNKVLALRKSSQILLFKV